MSRRGSVILHVLVTGTIVALIAACMLRVSMMNYLQTFRTNSETTQKRGDEGALARVQAYWSVNGSCTNAPGYSCGGGAGSATNKGSCGCTCTPSVATDPTIYTSGSIDACAMTITPPSDPMNPLNNPM